MKVNISRIKMELAKKEMTCAQLSELTDISRQTLSTIMHRQTCKPCTAGKIAKALGLQIEDIYLDS